MVARVTFAIFGLIISLSAIYAPELGLDPNSAWGWLRILWMSMGLCIFLVSVLYNNFKTKVNSGNSKYISVVTRSPLILLLTSNQVLRSIYRRSTEYGYLIPIILLVLVVYIWFVSSGTWTTWVSPTHHYANLARGFERGNLNLPARVDQRLLQLENPYDPEQRAGLKIPWDISLYQGKYYLYFGPVPAVLLVIVNQFITGRVGDLQLVFGFIYGIFLVLLVLTVEIWERYFRDLPEIMLPISILLIGLSGPVTFLLDYFRNARIYEAAITGGHFFLMLGFLLAYFALIKPIPSRLLLVCAGVAWASSIGCRQTLGVSIIFLLCMVIFRISMVSKGQYEIGITSLFLIAPMAIGVAALGWYNWARFGSITETGYFYQLAGPNIQKNFDILFSPAYLLQNLYNYLFAPFELDSKFPFIQLINGRQIPVLSYYSFPDIYNAQLMIGLFYIVPFIIFSLVPTGLFITKFFQSRGRKEQPGEIAQPHLIWAAMSLTGTVLIAFGTLLFFFWAAMRYMEDFTPALVFLSVIGFWQGYRLLEVKVVYRRLYLFAGLITSFASILFSTMVGIAIKVMGN